MISVRQCICSGSSEVWGVAITWVFLLSFKHRASKGQRSQILMPSSSRGIAFSFLQKYVLSLTWVNDFGTFRGNDSSGSMFQCSKLSFYNRTSLDQELSVLPAKLRPLTRSLTGEVADLFESLKIWAVKEAEESCVVGTNMKQRFYNPTDCPVSQGPWLENGKRCHLLCVCFILYLLTDRLQFDQISYNIWFNLLLSSSLMPCLSDSSLTVSHYFSLSLFIPQLHWMCLICICVLTVTFLIWFFSTGRTHLTVCVLYSPAV